MSGSKEELGADRWPTPAVFPAGQGCSGMKPSSVALVFRITGPLSEIPPPAAHSPGLSPAPGPSSVEKTQLKHLSEEVRHGSCVPSQGDFDFRREAGVNPRGPFERELTKNVTKWASFRGSPC